MITCKICGMEFEQKNKRVKCCSDKCKVTNRLENCRKWSADNRERHLCKSREWKRSNQDMVFAHRESYREIQAGRQEKKQRVIRDQSSIRENTKSQYERFPERFKNNHLKYKFNIGINDYKLMLSEQDNRCAICRKTETKTHKGKVCDLAVDHCHSTSAIRGLLCFDCNTALGKFKDSTALLEVAINYLKRSVKA